MQNLGWCSTQPDYSEAASRLAISINPLNDISQLQLSVERSQIEDSQDKFKPTSQALTGISNKFWRTGSVLKVAFTNGSQAQRDRVMAIAAQWTDHANIQFNVGDHEDPDIRIAFDQDRHSSRVGTDSRLSTQAGEVSMKFIGFNPGQGTVLHEFGHALGLKHEHQNPAAGIKWDKPAVYKKLGGSPHNWTKARVDNNVFNKLADKSLNYSQFDADSVMGYDIPATWTLDGFSTSPADALSPIDISYIGDWYPFGGSQRSVRRSASNHVEVFTRGISRRAFLKEWNGRDWQPAQKEWELVQDGRISGHIAVPEWTVNDNTVIAAREEQSGAPMVCTRQSGKWSSWKSLGGEITGSPTMVKTAKDTWLFVRGVSGQPFYKRSVDGLRWNTSTSGWTRLGGAITGLIGAAYTEESIAIVVRGVSGGAFIKWWNGKNWRPGEKNWLRLDGEVTAQPVVAWHEGKIHVVVRFPSGEPHHRIVDPKTEKSVGPWQPLGGAILGTPCLVHGQDSQLHLYVRGVSRRTFCKRWDGEQWSPNKTWENLGGQAVDSPTAITLPRTRQTQTELQVYVTGNSRGGFRKTWKQNSWEPGKHDWENLGGNLS